MAYSLMYGFASYKQTHTILTTVQITFYQNDFFLTIKKNNYCRENNQLHVDINPDNNH